MPTLFGRRYMRPELKSSGEIYVGIYVSRIRTCLGSNFAL